jgi:patatin-like phospholipase/acyl hydrolase
MPDRIRILAIDGGGIRGIIPAMVLQRIEELTAQPIAGLFDLVAGTSTGAVIALALLRGDSAGKPVFRAQDIVDLYRTQGGCVFVSSPVWRFLRLGGVLGEKYPAAGVERCLREHFGASRLSETLVDVLVTSYEIESRTPWVFRTRSARANPLCEDFELADIARAAIAAPTYFSPKRIPHPSQDDYYSFIDGGVHANNPAMCAYVEARSMYRRRKVLLVSLGTGDIRESILHRQPGGWGLARWARSLFGIVLDGTSSATDSYLSQLLKAEAYYRFQVELPRRLASLDNTKPENIRLLQLRTRSMLQKEDARLTELCRKLVCAAV